MQTELFNDRPFGRENTTSASVRKVRSAADAVLSAKVYCHHSTVYFESPAVLVISHGRTLPMLSWQE